MKVSDNIELREVTMNDSDFLYGLYVQREAKDILTRIKPSEQDDFVKSYMRKDKTNPFSHWYVVLFEGERAGSVSFNQRNNELGYWLLPEFRKKGIMTLALKCFIKMVGRKFCYVSIRRDNYASIRLIKNFDTVLTHYKFELRL